MIFVAIVLLGCGQEDEFDFVSNPKQNNTTKDDTSKEIDETQNDVDSSTDFDVSENINCDDVPYVTWTTYTQGMLMTHCQGCHASQSPTRYGAPEDVYFDDIEDALFWSERIRIRTLEVQDMPPAGGVFSEDLYLLQVWLECFSSYE